MEVTADTAASTTTRGAHTALMAAVITAAMAEVTAAATVGVVMGEAMVAEAVVVTEVAEVTELCAQPFTEPLAHA